MTPVVSIFRYLALWIVFVLLVKMDRDIIAIRAARYKRKLEQDDNTGIAAKVSRPSVEALATLTVLSWNIDGLDTLRPPQDLALRTFKVCEICLVQKPLVIFFQEVTEVSWRLLGSALSKDYWMCRQGAEGVVSSPEYFVAILLRKDTFLEPTSIKTESFPGSRMGRAVLKVVGVLRDHTRDDKIPCAPLLFATAHLESLKESRSERINQLRLAFKAMQGSDRVVFGGDLNIRDDEVVAAEERDHSSILDCWEAAGFNQQTRWTWDTSKNDNCGMKPGPKCRFDRVYVKGGFQVKSFSLVGQDRIKELRRFASDHFGVLVGLSV